MRHPKDRRRTTVPTSFPLEDSSLELVTSERRRRKDRRLENLNEEERQMLLSEMPWLTFYKRF
jgi:hypothetical protein